MTLDWDTPCYDTHTHIVNIVAIINYQQHIDLHLTHKKWKQSIFKPSKIPCVRAKFNFKYNNTVALIYHSGKIVVTGFNHINILHKAIHILNIFLQHTQQLIPITLTHQTANVVATTNIKQNIDIHHLQHTTIDTQIFPAAQLKLNTQTNIKATALFYNNGKIVVAGAKKEFLAHIALQYAVFNVLDQYIVDRFNTHWYPKNSDKNIYTLK